MKAYVAQTANDGKDKILGIYGTRAECETKIKDVYPDAVKDKEGDFIRDCGTIIFIEEYEAPDNLFPAHTVTVSRLKTLKQFENERIEVTMTAPTVQEAITKARYEIAVAFGEKPSKEQLKTARDQIDTILGKLP